MQVLIKNVMLYLLVSSITKVNKHFKFNLLTSLSSINYKLIRYQLISTIFCQQSYILPLNHRAIYYPKPIIEI